MSPRAAWRLEGFGFSNVYDFVPGKAAWLAMGWPAEGKQADEPTVGKLARRKVPVARLGETVGDARQRTSSDLDTCLIVNEAEIFMGRLRSKDLQGDAATPVEEAMEPGSSTVRPSAPLAGLVDRMVKLQLNSVVVTDLTGRLIGALLLDDAQKALEPAGR